MAEASQAKPIEDVRDISATTYGFMASKARCSRRSINSVSRTTRWRGRSRGVTFAKLSAEEGLQ